MKKISYAFVVAIAGILIFSGCLKDKGFDDQTYGTDIKEVKGVSFPQSAASPVALALNAVTTPQTGSVAVALESDQKAASDVKVNLVVNNALLGSGLTPVPSTAVIIPSSVTIPAGQSQATVIVTIPNASVLDPTVTYGIGLSLSSADGGYQIAQNMKNVVLQISIKNKYDGVYRIKGFATMGGNTPGNKYFNFDCNSDLAVQLSTSGASSVTMSFQPVITGSGPGYFNGLYPIKIDFNSSTDKVTNVSNLGSSNATYPYVFPDVSDTYNSRYDPATKTIYMRYRINNSGTWYAIDTLTYCRER